MVIMDPYYPPDSQEIWHQIDQLHLSYLEMEESPEKIDHRIRLEDRIRDFLYLVPHSQKFHFRQTAEVLNSSAHSKDFSAYKASTGWNAIQLYAGNLLSQPWRKEYKQIKTYCGFYKHQIEANLANAEYMFEAMGYRNCGGGVLILDGPICPDLVTNVSKDCLIAYVECQILKAIWEDLPPNLSISWHELLEFRRMHICSREQSVKALTYQYHQKQYQAQNATDYYNTSGRLNQQQYSMHNHMPYMYGTTCCNNYGAYLPPPPTNYYSTVPITYIKPPPPPMTNGYYGIPPPPTQFYEYPVPTGQLIEVEPHHNNGNYDVVDRPQSNKSEKESQFGDWDYVYRNLESQGYSKDLGERGDVLSPPNSIKKHKPTDLDDALNGLTLHSRRSEHKYDSVPVEVVRKHERKKSQGSSYENLTEQPKVVVKSRTAIVRDNKNYNNNPVLNGNKVSGKKDSWQCPACTFINENNKEICDMCCKTRGKTEQKMEIGGSQCSKCTLVNSKDTKICTACGASLKDSPTYI